MLANKDSLLCRVFGLYTVKSVSECAAYDPDVIALTLSHATRHMLHIMRHAMFNGHHSYVYV